MQPPRALRDSRPSFLAGFPVMPTKTILPPRTPSRKFDVQLSPRRPFTATSGSGKSPKARDSREYLKVKFRDEFERLVDSLQMASEAPRLSPVHAERVINEGFRSMDMQQQLDDHLEYIKDFSRTNAWQRLEGVPEPEATFRVHRMGKIERNPFTVKHREELDGRGFSIDGKRVKFNRDENFCAFVFPSRDAPQESQAILVGLLAHRPSAEVHTTRFKSRTTVTDDMLRHEDCRRTRLQSEALAAKRTSTFDAKSLPDGKLEAVLQVLDSVDDDDPGYADVVLESIATEKGHQLSASLRDLLNKKAKTDSVPIRTTSKKQYFETDEDPSKCVLYRDCWITPLYVMYYYPRETSSDAPRVLLPHELTMQLHMPLRRVKEELLHFKINRRHVTGLMSIPTMGGIPLTQIMSIIGHGVFSVDVTDADSDRVYYRHTVLFQ